VTQELVDKIHHLKNLKTPLKFVLKEKKTRVDFTDEMRDSLNHWLESNHETPMALSVAIGRQERFLYSVFRSKTIGRIDWDKIVELTGINHNSETVENKKNNDASSKNYIRITQQIKAEIRDYLSKNNIKKCDLSRQLCKNDEYVRNIFRDNVTKIPASTYQMFKALDGKTTSGTKSDSHDDFFNDFVCLMDSHGMASDPKREIIGSVFRKLYDLANK